MRKFMKFLFSKCYALLCLAAFFGAQAISCAADAAPVGPIVDVTLRSGETKKGQLLSFSEGSLSMKLENGSVVTNDGNAVVSVRFIAPEIPVIASVKPPVLTAQETELNITEIDRLNLLRFRDMPFKGIQGAKAAAANPLTDKEKSELAKLRARADIHIKALEQEIPNVTVEETAHAKLHELGRYYFYYGMVPQEIRSLLHIAVLGIKNEPLKHKMEVGMAGLWMTFVEKHKNYKQFEKLYERMQAPPAPAETKPQVSPDKPAVRP